MGSLAVWIWRTRRPALVPKTMVPVIASTKAIPTASVRCHVFPTVQYSRGRRGTAPSPVGLAGAGTAGFEGNDSVFPAAAARSRASACVTRIHLNGIARALTFGDAVFGFVDRINP
jgi:hypothetical protein